jgi:hypothetical protein
MAPEVAPGAPPVPPAAPKPSKLGSWMRAHWVELGSLAVAAVVGFFLIFRNHPAVQSALPTSLTGGGGSSGGSAPAPTAPVGPATGPTVWVKDMQAATVRAACAAMGRVYDDQLNACVMSSEVGGGLFPSGILPVAIQNLLGGGAAAAPPTFKPPILGTSVDGHSPIASSLGAPPMGALKQVGSPTKTVPVRPVDRSGSPTPLPPRGGGLRPLGPRQPALQPLPPRPSPWSPSSPVTPLPPRR